MARSTEFLTTEAQLWKGANGNYYVVSLRYQAVVDVATAIGRAVSGVYMNSRIGCWALRVKNKSDKRQLDALLTATTPHGSK